MKKSLVGSALAKDLFLASGSATLPRTPIAILRPPRDLRRRPWPVVLLLRSHRVDSFPRQPARLCSGGRGTDAWGDQFSGSEEAANG